jgi:serine protease Do
VYGFKNGVLVQSVQPGGPAERAGLRGGDIIVSVDGRNIKDGDDLVNEITTRHPGSTIRIGYIRDGKQADASVTIGDLDKVFADAGVHESENAPEERADPGEAKLGLVVRDVPPAAATKIHTPGVMVQSVRTGSFADLKGLEPGLVITHINRQSTASKDQYDAVVGKLKTGDDVVFEVIDPRRPDQGTSYLGGTLE